MLIIWGFKVLFKTISQGQFHCPSCRADRTYNLRQGRRYFTVFWIPIIPLKAVGAVVECTTCKKKFNQEVLDLPTTAETATGIGFARRAIAAHMVDVSDNTTVARDAAIAMIREGGLAGYDQAQLDVDRQTSDWERVQSWAAHLGGTLSPAGAEQLLLAAARVATADEQITDREREVIAQLGSTFGLTPVHIEGIIASANSNAPHHHG